MKKAILAAALVLSATSALAVTVDANVSGVSNYVYRGKSLSANGFSASTDIKAELPFDTFVDYTGHTVNLGDGTNLEHKLSAGLNYGVGPVALSTGYTQTLYTGGTGTTQPKQHNNGEVFVKASAFGVNGLIAKTVDAGISGSKDTYARVGYTAPAIYGVTADVGLGYTHYQTAGVTKRTATEATLSYQALKNVKTFVGYSYGGKDANDNRLPKLAFVGASIGF